MGYIGFTGFSTVSESPQGRRVDLSGVRPRRPHLRDGRTCSVTAVGLVGNMGFIVFVGFIERLRGLWGFIGFMGCFWG